MRGPGAEGPDVERRRPSPRSGWPGAAGALGLRGKPTAGVTVGPATTHLTSKLMRLTDVLKPECIKVPLQHTQRREAIFELADLLAEHNGIEELDTLRDAIWAREQTRTTGIGGGIAVPHGKTDGVTQLCMAIGRTSEPIDFGSVDRKPVELIILLASPIDQTGPHVTALSKISQMLIDVVVRERIKRCTTGQEIYDFIEELESRAVV